MTLPWSKPERPELQKDAKGLLPGEAQHGVPDFLRRADPYTDLMVPRPASPPAVRYFFHPESGGLFTTEDGSFPPSDGLVEEVSAEDYARLTAELTSPADSPPATFPWQAPP